MKNRPLIIFIVVVLILILGFGFFKAMTHNEKTATQSANNAMHESINPTATPAAMMNHDTTNQQLDTDTKDIQDNLNNLQTDRTSVDQSINQATSE